MFILSGTCPLINLGKRGKTNIPAIKITIPTIPIIIVNILWNDSFERESTIFYTCQALKEDIGVGIECVCVVVVVS